MSSNSTSASENTDLLQAILAELKALKQGQIDLKTEQNAVGATIEAINGRVNALAGVKQSRDGIAHDASLPSPVINPIGTQTLSQSQSSPPSASVEAGQPTPPNGSSELASAPPRRGGTFSKIILTSYPGQAGVDPLPMEWGAQDPQKRGPIVVSRHPDTIRRRNAIGAHGGSYSIYFALALASKQLETDHRPDFTNTEPAAALGPHPTWCDPKKIVAMDPWGHLAPWLFKDIIRDENVDIRPTIAITKAHMKLPELEESVRKGRLVPDGRICLNESGELAVTKVAVEPVWYLPGVAERFGIDEGTLRRSLFEHTGGSYPELITRGDVKLFMPPIGGLTVYIFGDPAKMSDANARLALRVHDECNGSDVFGSDICTCRPYLTFGIEEAVKEAQKGGSGVVIYFRKEGRALGEVTKYLVYNARKRGSDKASEYFKRTENIAGVKDMRFQALMPDILHWLGITKIDRMLSMSNMKHDAIVEQGIPIHERVPIPDDMIPEDSRVEIDAKIHAGYFTTGKIMTMAELDAVKGRAWEDVDVSAPFPGVAFPNSQLTWSCNSPALMSRRHTRPFQNSDVSGSTCMHGCLQVVAFAEQDLGRCSLSIMGLHIAIKVYCSYQTLVNSPNDVKLVALHKCAWSESNDIIIPMSGISRTSNTP
jgi:GTP cyclohydrolase II